MSTWIVESTSLNDTNLSERTIESARSAFRGLSA
jgi:hypothetical protein